MLPKQGLLIAVLCLSVIPEHAAPGLTRDAAASGKQIAFIGSQAKEEVLTNDSVIQLLKVGLDEDSIISKVQITKCNFDTSTQGLINLKQAGASNRLIQVMINSAKDAKNATSVPAMGGAPTGNADTASYPNEMGVYIKKDGQWVDVQPEVVNWKTGGVLKNIATAGIVKGDVNGNINGPHSRNAVKAPMEFVIVAAEGVAITEYQLIKLREQKDYREFRTVTGGVLHASGGATRDLLQFEGTKVASRTFLVNLPTLGAGEYGFLPPGAFVSSNSSVSWGKCIPSGSRSELCACHLASREHGEAATHNKPDERHPRSLAIIVRM